MAKSKINVGDSVWVWNAPVLNEGIVSGSDADLQAYRVDLPREPNRLLSDHMLFKRPHDLNILIDEMEEDVWLIKGKINDLLTTR